MSSMSETSAQAELLVCIVKDHHQVEEILTGFLELGLRGASVVEGRGMGHILATEVPIFAGFKALFPGGGAGTYLVLSVVESEMVEDAIQLAEEICGDFRQAGTGFVFTVPVQRVRGLAEAIQ
jgi:nitrogen regulatory protein P-II 1